MFHSLRARMPRLGRWPRLALAACCLLLALDSAVSAHGAARRGNQPAAAVEPVVVVAKDLAPGTRLTRADLTTASWPPKLVPLGAFRDVDEVVGRRLAAAVTRRDVVTRARLIGRELTTGLAHGVVAMPVTLGDPRTSDLFHPGDYIDLLATPRPDDATGTEVPARHDAEFATVIGSHLRVLAVLPGNSDAAPELVLAADRLTALRIAHLGVSQILAGVGVPP